jgi:hypothetical protein
MTIADSVISNAPPTAPLVPNDYLGLSIEWSMVRNWFGKTGNAHINQSLVNLLSGLRRTSAQTGVLRIGGDSQDGHRYVPGGCTADNTLFTGVITADMVDAVLQVADDAGWKVILGLNLKQNDPLNAADLVDYATNADVGGVIEAFEIGNEPNGYFTNTADYLARVGTYLDAIDPDGSLGVPITGPAISNDSDVSYVQALWETHQDRMPYATWHDYANSPNLGSLLQTAKIDQLKARVAEVNAAIGSGNSRMDEGNSVGNGGLDLVSNVVGTAAWLLDALCAAAQTGQRGFNLHSWDGYYFPDNVRTCWYTPFVIRQSMTQPRPPYYALQLFKFAVGRRFCPVSTSNAAGSLVRTWAFQDPTTGKLYVYVLNKAGTGHGGLVSLTAPGHSGTAFLNLLSDGSGCGGKQPGIQGAALQPDGSISWAGTALAPVSAGRWEFTLPECGSALVVLP